MTDVPDWVEAFEEAECEYCHKKIYWVKHVKGYKIPVDPNWKPHRLSCPYADRWAKKTSIKKKEVKQTTLEDWARHDDQ
ncbi:hypothetical protein HS7_20810 [Sulfolobales archaeon HS-7]|nr:hypothetical protein HS7_20810 [Sulfolobales archaeon HS-7]